MREATKQQFAESHYTRNGLDGKLWVCEYQTFATARILYGDSAILGFVDSLNLETGE